MKKIVKKIPAGILSVLVALSCLAPSAYALGPDDPRIKNNIGMYTVKCQVHKNATGNPVAGFVIGNHKNDPEKAEKEANNFVSRFGGNHAKRHCKTTGQYRQNGAYSTNWTPK